MRYFIINKKTKRVEGYLGGYTTLEYAKRWGRLRYEFLKPSCDYNRGVLHIPPGIEFAKANEEWFNERYEIIKVSKMAFKLPDGEGYIEQEV